MARPVPDRGARRPAAGVHRLPVGPLAAVRFYLAQRVKVRLAYRADLVVNALGDVLLAAVGPLFLGTLFQHVRHVGDWTGPEVLFCWGFAECVVGLFFFAFAGLYQLNQRYILGGELDRVLLRPVDPLAQVLLDNLSLEDLPIVLLGLVIMAGAVAWGLPPLPWWKWALLPVFLVAGTAVLGGLLTALGSLGFHLHHRGTAVGLVFQLSTFTRYPLDLFARPLRWLLTFALPLGFAGFYPAVFFLPHPQWHVYAWAQPALGAACAAFGYGAWRFGLSRYTSSGS